MELQADLCNDITFSYIILLLSSSPPPSSYSTAIAIAIATPSLHEHNNNNCSSIYNFETMWFVYGKMPELWFITTNSIANMICSNKVYACVPVRAREILTQIFIWFKLLYKWTRLDSMWGIDIIVMCVCVCASVRARTCWKPYTVKTIRERENGWKERDKELHRHA